MGKVREHRSNKGNVFQFIRQVWLANGGKESSSYGNKVEDKGLIAHAKNVQNLNKTFKSKGI